MAAYQPDGRNRTARKLAEEARKHAIDGDWQAAADVNRKILEASARDVEAMNRLGKALMEIGNLDDAIDVYRQALSLDSSNVIAQRNAGRLEQLISAKASDSVAATAAHRSGNAVLANVFVQEVGKTFMTDLIRPTDDAILTQLAPADEVELQVEDKNVAVYDQHGNKLGQLEPKIAQRMIRLIESGNRFKVYVVALTGMTARIILREVSHDPDSPYPVAFQRQATIAAPRPYLRDTRRMARELEPDLLDNDDDDDDGDDDDDEEESEGFEELSDDDSDDDYSDDDDDDDSDEEEEEEDSAAQK
ncbi:MAG: tetratricopeptide repeat protein [Nitrolancea sp.]